MNSRATQLKFWCSRISHYASRYHYGSQSIAFSGQWECWAGWSQPVNCINLHKRRTPHCTAEWTYCLFPILCLNASKSFSWGMCVYSPITSIEHNIAVDGICPTFCNLCKKSEESFNTDGTTFWTNGWIWKSQNSDIRYVTVPQFISEEGAVPRNVVLRMIY